MTRFRISSMWFFSFLAAIGVLVAAATVRAQIGDPAAAATLFEQGRTASQSGDHVRACKLFAESHRLDPRVGTLLNLARCEENQNHIAAAWQYAKQSLDLATSLNDKRASYARQRIDMLGKRVAWLTIRIDLQPTEGVVVRRNGVELHSASLGIPLPVDSGAHQVTAQAPGYQASTVSIQISEGETKEVALSLGPTGAETSSSHKSVNHADHGPAGLHPAESRQVGMASAASEPTRSRSGPLPYVLAGAGVVGLGVGTGFMLHALSKRSESGPPHCDANDDCDAVGLSLRQDARSAGDIATIAFAAGATVLAASAVVWIIQPSRPKQRPVYSLSVAPGSMNLSARW